MDVTRIKLVRPLPMPLSPLPTYRRAVPSASDIRNVPDAIIMQETSTIHQRDFSFRIFGSRRPEKDDMTVMIVMVRETDPTLTPRSAAIGL